MPVRQVRTGITLCKGNTAQKCTGSYIESVQNSICIQIPCLPVGKFCFRKSQQPFLQQHHICQIRFVVCIDVTGNHRRFCSSCSSGASCCGCCRICGCFGRCRCCYSCSYLSCYSSGFCLCLPFLTTAAGRFPLLHIGTVCSGCIGDFYITGITRSVCQNAVGSVQILSKPEQLSAIFIGPCCNCQISAVFAALCLQCIMTILL